MYRVSHLLVDSIGLTLNLDGSTVCPILPGLMGFCQKLLCSCSRWWNTQTEVNTTQVHEQMGHPVDMLQL